MRRALEHHQLASLHRLVRPQGCGRDWQDAIVIPMQHQRWDTDAGQIGPKVGEPRCYAGVRGRWGGASTNVPALANDLVRNTFAEQDVEVVEVREERGEVGETVVLDARLDVFEDAPVDPGGVVGCLQEKRRD